MTHICVGNLNTVGSDTGLLPGRRQAIIWTNPVNWTLRNKLEWNFIRTSDVFIEENAFESVWRPFCLGLNVLKPLSHKQFFYTQTRSALCGLLSVGPVPSRTPHLSLCLLTLRHIQLELTNRFAYRAFNDNSLVCFIVNECRTNIYRCKHAIIYQDWPGIYPMLQASAWYMYQPWDQIIKIHHGNNHISCKKFQSWLSDWLSAQPPANQKPCLKILVN